MSEILSKPNENETLAGIAFAYEPEHIDATIENIARWQGGLNAEIAIYHNNGEGRSMLHHVRGGLLSQNFQRDLAKRLSEYDTVLDVTQWNQLVLYVCHRAVQHHRRGEPTILLKDSNATTNKIDWLVHPILERNAATTIFAPGGYLKSYIACYLGLLVHHDRIGLTEGKKQGWVPKQANVMYLDYESGPDSHTRRGKALKHGLGIDADDIFYYRQCTQPLAQEVEDLRREVVEHEIELVIVDSQLAAVDGNPNDSEPNQAYYNALRALHCTTLTLDHSPKTTEGQATPFGSVTKWNRARSVFEIKKHQEVGEKHVVVSLAHRKNNEGKLLEPIGIRFDFDEDTEGNLVSVYARPADVSEFEELSGDLPQWQQIKNQILAAGEPITIKEIAEGTGLTTEKVRARLHEHKDKFVKLGTAKEAPWGIKYREQ